MKTWNVEFLKPSTTKVRRALIVLNQPFSFALLHRLWRSSEWHCCADGGANRLYDLLDNTQRLLYLPHLIKGDLDSLRDDVAEYYGAKGVHIVHDRDQNSTDLMKSVVSLEQRERLEGGLGTYELLILGGLTGRLDQTFHTLSVLHKLRKTRDKAFAVTDDNVGWVLDSGEHMIKIDHSRLGKTCGLLPVGIESTVLTTSGLEWNLCMDTSYPCPLTRVESLAADSLSSIDGLVSTSNHLVPGQNVWIKTTKPIWWTVELGQILD
ncbi:hypothetical protein M378DRAFT_178795 [Amanita muscaria Koide BX008]|uniref:Thiamine pyrophosphokinase n=1 Tax=Amanita muscaria (strain Koide BX008) TaxID=946122 RepID=A0A0C2SMK2_AMAMK|nr:hypothetical protein M378DRAFT_178795 [Amanita muscaria Koide BX008]